METCKTLMYIDGAVKNEISNKRPSSDDVLKFYSRMLVLVDYWVYFCFISFRKLKIGFR